MHTAHVSIAPALAASKQSHMAFIVSSEPRITVTEHSPPTVIRGIEHRQIK